MATLTDQARVFVRHLEDELSKDRVIDRPDIVADIGEATAILICLVAAMTASCAGSCVQCHIDELLEANIEIGTKNMGVPCPSHKPGDEHV